jgi:hypothetical protein
MKGKTLGVAVALALALSSASVRQAEAVHILPLDDSWTILDEGMEEGDFFLGADFSGLWEWSSTRSVLFTITDLFVASDQFEVYDHGVLVFTTPSVPDWPDLGSADPFDPPHTGDPDVALASGFFSSFEFLFAPGDHSISIRDIHIPPVSPGGSPFPDGTVAFKAKAVPEPGVILLLGFGLLGLRAAHRPRR